MMINFLNQAAKEIDILKKYYLDLSTFQRDYLFPGSLKIALDSYIASNDVKTQGLAVYQALFNTNYLLRSYPYGFGYLDIFSNSDYSPATKACYLAFVDNKITTDNQKTNQDNFCAIKLNDYENDIRLLKDYSTSRSLFKTLFFPTSLAKALTEYKEVGSDSQPIYEAYSKATSNIFIRITLSFLLPGIDRFGRTPLAQSYNDIVAENFNDNMKQNIFDTLRHCDVPYKALCFIMELNRQKFLSGGQSDNAAYFKAAKNYANDNNSQDYNALIRCFSALKQVCVLNELTIQAITESSSYTACVAGFKILSQKKLLTKTNIDILKTHASPKEAALALIHNLNLDSQTDQACSTDVTGNSSKSGQDTKSEFVSPSVSAPALEDKSFGLFGKPTHTDELPTLPRSQKL